MHVPVVAIVGRPNVGKSTFFNRVLHRRQAVVDDTPGVTRDRHAGLADWTGRSFFLVDTGGWLPSATEGMEALIADQVLQALNECDAVVFMADGREGLQPLDEEISRTLHQLSSHVPVLLLVNKVDGERWDAHVHEFAALGWETLLPVSAAEGRLVAETLDALVGLLPARGSMQEPEEGVRIAILGRPNVGKSSLTNRLIGQERVIVDEAPGTTRDAIDVPWRWHKRTFWLIDTAGIRHRWDHLPGFEFYASLRSIRALERADVALLLLDATEKTSRQDQRVAALIEESGKPVLILVNKWDAVEKDTATMNRYEEEVREALSFLDYAPMMFISALTGQRTSQIAEKVLAVYEAGQRQVATHEVNDVLRQSIERTPPRGTHGKRAPKILYATQIRSSPPTFALFTRNPEGIGAEYTRYLGRRFREAFGFEGSPVRFKIRRTTGSTPARGRRRT
jgi:GTP-binding protein